MARASGGEAAIQALAAEGVRTVFGIPGTHALPLFDALLDVPEVTRITARHEQGAAFMADGYARASGEVGVCMTTTGPGALNTLAAMGTAYADSSPVLNIFSQVPSYAIGRNKGYLHELHDQLSMFDGVTKWTARAESVSAIPGLVHDAMLHLRNGRPRPAALEIPVDVLNAEGYAGIQPPARSMRSQPDSASVGRAADLLAGAERLLIWAGGGVISSGASLELTRLAEMLRAPVLCSRMGRGAISDAHPLCLGSTATRRQTREYVASCDAVLVVGSRLDASDTSEWKLKLPERLVQIDVDPSEIGRNYPVAAGILGDAKDTLAQLTGMLEGRVRGYPGPEREVGKVRSSLHAELSARSKSAVRLVEDIQQALPEGAIIVNDITICAYWGSLLFSIREPRTYLYPAGFVTLGFGLPAAIGARVACPDRTVLAICGDGGFLYTATELATAVHHGVNVVVLLVNDNRFGILEPQQLNKYGRTSMIDLTNPDFVAFARSFGAYACAVDDMRDVGTAIRAAIAANRPAVVELKAKLPHPFDW